MSDISDININHKTKLYVKPRMDQQLIGISDDCLIIQSFYINLSLTMGWTAALVFWLIGLPCLLFAIVAPWMPPYGYRDDGTEVTSFIESISGVPFTGFLIYLLFYVIAMGGTAVAMSLGVSYFYLRTLKKAFSPITFNRKTQMVSIYSQGEKEQIEWSKLSCSMVNVKYASGYVIHQSMILQLNNLSKYVKIGIEGSLVVGALDDGEHEGVEGNWEYIRQYMEQGPDHLTLSTTPVIGLNHLDKQPMYSYNIQDSLRGNWFWPILKTKDRSKIGMFFTYLYWPIKVAFFIPNLLADWLWRRMCLRTLKDSKATPQHSMKNCGKQLLTTNDAETVSTVEEASIDNNLTYAEIKKRLQTASAPKPKQLSLALALLVSSTIYVFFYFLFFNEDFAYFLFGWFITYIMGW